MAYLLVWDVDGTLIRISGAGKKALSAAFLELYGVKDAFLDVPMAGMLDAVIIKNVFDSYCIPESDRAAFIPRYLELLRERMGKAGPSVACPGIKRLLPALQDAGCFYNVLGTGNIEQGARIKLELDGLNRFFPTGGFGDREIERWQMIEDAVANARTYFHRDFDRENIHIIGDTPKDIACGVMLGARTVGVATGSYSMDDLAACGADYVFKDFEDIGAFMRIFKKNY